MSQYEVRFGRRAFPTGGDDGIRTHDPLLAGQVLSQLSYTPIRVYIEFPSGHSKLNNKRSVLHYALLSRRLFLVLSLFPNTMKQFL